MLECNAQAAALVRWITPAMGSSGTLVESVRLGGCGAGPWVADCPARLPGGRHKEREYDKEEDDASPMIEPPTRIFVLLNVNHRSVTRNAQFPRSESPRDVP